MIRFTGRHGKAGAIAIAATAAVAVSAVALSHAGTAHGTAIRVADAAAISTSPPPVTGHMGPIAANSVALQNGPGYGYTAAAFAQPFQTYAITCFSSPVIDPGTAGPYGLSDLSTVWYLLADPATPTLGIGYILATTPVIQFSTANASIPDQVGRCASDPPLPAPSSPTGDGAAISAQTPQKCAGGILSPGLNNIRVHSSTSHLDIEFTSGSLAPMNVDVLDQSTGQSGSGDALTDPSQPTYHFTEDQNTAFGDHNLAINVEGALGAGEDTIDGDVGWEVVSGDCIP
jgi:hypothetical protein